MQNEVIGPVLFKEQNNCVGCVSENANYDEFMLICMECSRLKTDNYQPKITAKQTIRDTYLMVLDCLEPNLRAMIDNPIQMDNYYIAEKGGMVIGGFGFNEDGELKGLFSLYKGNGKELFKLRVEVAKEKTGADRLYLNCLGDKLRLLYEQFGFLVTKSERWNPRFAPKNWDYLKFGKPDVYYMEKVWKKK